MKDDSKVCECECECECEDMHKEKDPNDTRVHLNEENEKFQKEIVPQWEKELDGLKTPEDLAKFVHHLMDDYVHDYGTVCYALGYAALAGARVADRHPGQGGITGFQAGAVMWTFIQKWTLEKGPMKLVRFSNMLYPQYDYRFARTITKDTWGWLKAEAKRLLQESSDAAAERVVEHWKSIVAGVVPFGYAVADDD